ncbi:hypothetical protein QQZ08_009096 [Neonectria magnoliae]|uniref:Uncharacterized protein n=1 Tax=Neonectria magnoliae TaxID=2732573 RepID=A0ABR1HQA4_9HYPO
MKFKVGNWLEGKLGGRRTRSARPEENLTNLPWLPSTRPYALTPSSSKEVLTPGSPLFEKLPRELRHQILVLASGDAIVHMDLSFVHPAVALAPGSWSIISHAGIDSVGYSIPPVIGTRKSKSLETITVDWERSIAANFGRASIL